MSRTARNSLLVLLVALLVMSISLAVVGAEEGEEGSDGAEATTTTVSGLVPAVEIESEATETAQADWTYRYMIPTGLALAGVIIVLTAVKYFTDVVRKRYRIVE